MTTPQPPWDSASFARLADLTGEISRLLTRAPRSVRHKYVLPADGSDDNVALARHLYFERRIRDGLFGKHSKIFSEPAWDVLLDLFIAQGEGREVAASGACIDACVPPTTALRCMRRLAESGLIVRRKHPKDRRVTIVEISQTGSMLVAGLFDAVGQSKSLGPCRTD